MTLTPARTIPEDASPYTSTVASVASVSTVHSVLPPTSALHRPNLPVFERLRDGVITADEAAAEIDAIPGWTERLAEAEAQIDAREAEGR